MSEKEELEKELAIMRREKEIRQMLAESNNIETDYFFVEGLLRTAKVSDEGEIILKVPGKGYTELKRWPYEYTATEQGKRRLREPQSQQDQPRDQDIYKGMFHK